VSRCTRGAVQPGLLRKLIFPEIINRNSQIIQEGTAFDFWDTFDIIRGVGLCKVTIMKVCCIALFALVVPNCVNSSGYIAMPYQPVKNICKIRDLCARIELCISPHYADGIESAVPLCQELERLLPSDPKNDAEDCVVGMGRLLIEEVGSSVLLR
jgi:hypothetical protein